MKIYYRRLLYTFYTPQQYTLQDKKTRNKRKKMQQNSQLLATETGPYDEGGKNASRRFSLIYRSHLHAAGKRYQTLSTTISTGITIYSRPAIVCVHSTVKVPPALFIFLPWWLSLLPYVQRWITPLYRIILSFNGVFLFFSLRKGREGLLIIVNDFTIKKWKHEDIFQTTKLIM